jgi:hypothetical protein
MAVDRADARRRFGEIVLLIRSEWWWRLEPETSCGHRERRGAKPTDRNEEWIDCPDCGGEGKRRVRGVLVSCVPCAGRGTRLVDQYTGRELSSELTEVRTAAPLRRVACDACIGLDPSKEKGEGWIHGERCIRCDGSGWTLAFQQRIRPFRSGYELYEVLLEREEITGDPAIDAGTRRRKAGSYDELLLALAALRVDDLPRYRALAALEADLRPFAQLLYDRPIVLGLVFVERRMPTPIRVPQAVLAEERRLAYDERKKLRRGKAA